jgi:hypothetical protein
MKVFSILYDIKEGLSCYPGTISQSALYECGFNPLNCPNGFNNCNPHVKVNEAIESIEEWERRFAEK